jgi:hypothetical protein
MELPLGRLDSDGKRAHYLLRRLQCLFLRGVRLRLSSSENSDVFVYETQECAPIIGVGRARMRTNAAYFQPL